MDTEDTTQGLSSAWTSGKVSEPLPEPHARRTESRSTCAAALTHCLRRCELAGMSQANGHGQSELPGASLASRQSQGRKQSCTPVNLKLMKTCPECSTPATAKSEVWLSGHKPGHQIPFPGDVELGFWIYNPLVGTLEQAGTVSAYKSHIRKIILFCRNLTDTQQCAYE